MEHAGQKSVKDKLPEQRKGSKRAIECRLKVQTHIWEQEARGSSPRTPTRLSLDAIRVPGSAFYLPLSTRNDLRVEPENCLPSP